MLRLAILTPAVQTLGVDSTLGQITQKECEKIHRIHLHELPNNGLSSSPLVTSSD